MPVDTEISVDQKVVEMVELVEPRGIVFCRISVGTIVNAATKTPLQILLLLTYSKTFVARKEHRLKEENTRLKTTIN
jgi:hypothetical protein